MPQVSTHKVHFANCKKPLRRRHEKRTWGRGGIRCEGEDVHARRLLPWLYFIACLCSATSHCALLNLPASADSALGVVLVALTLPVLYDCQWMIQMGRLCKEKTNLVGLVLSSLEDLDNALVLVVGAELVLQRGLASAVQDTLGTVTDGMLEQINWYRG